MAKQEKQEPKSSQGPRCPFCGRRNTVRKLEGQVRYCNHCQKMFQP